MKLIVAAILLLSSSFISLESSAAARSCDDYCSAVGANLRYLGDTPVCMMILECDPACGRMIYDLKPIRKAYYCAFRKFNPPNDAVCMTKEECAADNSVVADASDIEMLTKSPRSTSSSRYRSRSGSSSGSAQ